MLSRRRLAGKGTVTAPPRYAVRMAVFYCRVLLSASPSAQFINFSRACASAAPQAFAGGSGPPLLPAPKDEGVTVCKFFCFIRILFLNTNIKGKTH